MKYNAKVMEHFANPRNVGVLPDANAVGEATNEACMDRMKLYLRVEGDCVKAATFQVEGCVPCIAAGSVLTEKISGIEKSQLEKLDADWLLCELNDLPATKKHAAYLAIEALRSAMDSFHAEKSQSA